MRSEVFEALRAIDIPEEKALKAAAALSRRDEDVADLKTDTALLKRMVGTLYPLVLAGLGSAIALWLKLGDISAQLAVLARSLNH